ncbi:M61 family peptidase [Undibacterium sp. TJN19]|uniref:M61 family metallopeptidase n=1 Tax=Undibacterium sp. TJN19 TaxID=3413055 RepID=UPI003BF060D6
MAFIKYIRFSNIHDLCMLKSFGRYLMKACWLLLAALLAGKAGAASIAPITLSVDLRDTPRKLLHVVETISVQPGPLTLAYPKWVPAQQRPGPIQQQAGLVIRGDGKVIRWHRDAHDVYLYHLDVPTGVHSIEINSDFIATDGSDGAHGSVSDTIAVLSWQDVTLYPYVGATTRVADIQVSPSVVLPSQWRYASALEVAKDDKDGTIGFRTVSVDRLFDSPLISGLYFREVALAPEITPSHYLDLVADTPANLEVPQAYIEKLSNLVRQSGQMFRHRHYDSFRFLITLSNQISGGASDHHQSLEERRPANFLTDEKSLVRSANSMPHDLAHSWNGKYRRPVGLSEPNYQLPPDGSELWIVEGLSEYLGSVLTARAGMWDLEQYRNYLARNGAFIEHRQGRQWRDLEDNGRMAINLWTNRDGYYDNWRRGGFDFYGEGALVWFDVDVALRNASEGKKSLDDFAALFYGDKADSGPLERPYLFKDIVAALNQVVAKDWDAFLRNRAESLGTTTVLSGIHDAGYRLAYNDQAAAPTSANSLFEYTVGMSIQSNGEISDVLVKSAARNAGLAPGMIIATVQGKPYSAAVLQQAIREAKGGSAAIQLTLSNGSSINLVYHDGARYPALERIPNAPDRLAEIIKAR